MATFPLRFRSIPASTTKAELSELFSVSPECISLARTEWKEDSLTATVTFKKPKPAKWFLKNDVFIGDEKLLVDDHFLNLTVLSSHDDDVVDIIAVHGLNGHAFNTWAAAGGTMWLRDFLPEHFPKARILTYGYNSNVRNSDAISDTTEFAKQLLVFLVDNRQSKEEKERPIIFICHSLGGIVVKAALNMAIEEDRTHIINRVTRGIVFLATPHAGSATADYGNLLGIIFKTLDIRTILIADLGSKSRSLMDLSGRFRQHYDSLKIATFYETKKTPIPGWTAKSRVIVDKQSAVLHLKHEEQTPLERDHREICRFGHKEEGDYKAVRRQLERFCDAIIVLPEVSTADGNDLSVPSELKLCSESGEWPYPSYPVLILGDYTYWPLSYIDNRYALAIVVVDQHGNIVKTCAANGTRYIQEIQVDTKGKKVTFLGQAGSKCTLSWETLLVKR